MRICCIYKIESIVSPHKIYIGSTYWLSHRTWRHKNQLKIGDHDNDKLQFHVNKYGLDDLIFSIIEIVELKENLLSREQFYLDTLNPWFNLQKIAGNCLGRKHSEETKRKIGEGNKGKVITIEQREKMRNAKLGIKWDDESKKRLSERRKGVPRSKPFSEETKLKMSKSQMGNKNNIKGWITRRAKLLNKVA